MLQTRLLAIRPAATRDIDPDDGPNHFSNLRGRNDDAEIAGEGLVPRRAAEGDAKKQFVADAHRLDSNVIGILDRADQAAAVESNVELARQIVEGPIIQD